MQPGAKPKMLTTGAQAKEGAGDCREGDGGVGSSD